MMDLVLKGIISTGVGFVILVCLLAIVTALFYILSQYFKRHEGINRAYRILIYLLTMVVVVGLVLAGILGIFIPFIPGLLLLVLALALLRRYYKNAWVDAKLRWVELTFKIKMGVKRVRKHVRKRKEKIGKALRRRKKQKKK